MKNSKNNNIILGFSFSFSFWFQLMQRIDHKLVFLNVPWFHILDDIRRREGC